MIRRRSFILALTIAITVVFVFASYFGYREIIHAQNSRQLQGIATQTLTRTEVAIDLVVMKVAELIAGDANACNSSSIAKMREAAFEIGSIKDIHFSSPDGSCSGFSDIHAMKLDTKQKLEYRMALNPGLGFSKIDDPQLSGLGVAWTSPAMQSFLAVMSTESMLFDMLPATLRESASISLLLDDHTVVSRYGKPTSAVEVAVAESDFIASSARYPVVVKIVVSQEALANWNQDVSWPLKLAVLIVAAVIAFLISCAVIREPGPIEELDRAIKSGELVPHFQPIVSLKDGEVVGCEMLARWIKPDGSMVSPGRFIPIAEMSGRSEALSETLLLAAGQSLGSYLRENPKFKLTFNVTPEQFLKEGFVSWIEKISKKAGMHPGQLVVELTERQEMSSLEQAQAVCEQLSKLGVKLALDDTGTGHNGLSCITSLGASCIKIDKLFIDGITGETRSRTLVELLVNAAREFEMTTVAEGIESEEQVHTLRELGATEGQGYYFSKALDAGSFITYCEANSASKVFRRLFEKTGQDKPAPMAA